MSGKEAILICLDIGSSMRLPYLLEKTKTKLEISVDCINLLLQ